MHTVFKQLDFGLLFGLIVAVFLVIASIQLSSSWSDGQRGLLLYEKTCPLNTSFYDEGNTKGYKVGDERANEPGARSHRV